MIFTPASHFSVVVFIIILLTVSSSIIAGVHVSVQVRRSKKRTLLFTAVFLLWLAIISIVATSGFVEAQPMPRLPILFSSLFVVAALFAFSSLGKQMAKTIPISALIAFQTFRLPLELVLQSWSDQGTIPTTMTWTGQNFDIVSGVLAFICFFVMKKAYWMVWLTNIVGFAMLVNVIRVVIFTSPLPFAWPVDPPLQLAFHFPYVLIAPVCVAGALAGHLILTRALLLQSRDLSSQGL